MRPSHGGGGAPSGPAATNAAPSAALRCRQLVKPYGDVVAVDGLDLEVYVGECFGLLGPNGAGKAQGGKGAEGPALAVSRFVV